MTENTWPDPARPGVPLNPERDGWHWLSAMYYDDPIGPPVACFWEAKLERWPRLQDKPGNYPVSRGFCYLGPCLTPDEAAALQKRVAELEKAVIQCRSLTKFLKPQADRIAELEALLRAIEADCESDCPPSHGAIKYACRAALGGKDE